MSSPHSELTDRSAVCRALKITVETYSIKSHTFCLNNKTETLNNEKQTWIGIQAKLDF